MKQKKTTMELIKSYIDISVVCLIVEAKKLDMSNTSEFKKAVALYLPSEIHIVLDMSQVEFVDSTGLGAILSLLRDVRARGAELRLCSVQPRVMAMFELVRMQKIVPLSRTQNEASAAFTLSKAA